MGVCAHGCKGCPHPVSGQVVAGAATVFAGGRPVARGGDATRHGVCCGPGQGQVVAGGTVYAEGKPVARQGDQVQLCGGIGGLLDGNPTVCAG